MGPRSVRMVWYRTVEPVVFNPGTDEEVSYREFLAYFSDKPMDELWAEVDAINDGLIPVLQNGQPADIENKTYFAAERQLFD